MESARPDLCCGAGLTSLETVLGLVNRKQKGSGVDCNKDQAL